MILCGVDFSVYYFIIMRKFKLAFKSDEVKAYFAIILVAIAIISVNCYGFFGSIYETIKHAAFQVGSIITTTGFSTVDYNKWPELSKTVLVIFSHDGAK